MNPNQITTEWPLSVGCDFLIPNHQPLLGSDLILVRDVNFKTLGWLSFDGTWKRAVLPEFYKPRFRVKAPSIPTHEAAA